MRKYLFALLLILSLPLLILAPHVFGQAANSYSASGYVYDDLNANGRFDQGEQPISGAFIYADATNSQHYTTTDAYGHFALNNLPAGNHSIEIKDAGSGGSRPTTSERFSVSGTTSAVSFGIQKGGYGVDGYVTDPSGRAVPGALVYVDLPNRQATYTNAQGYYRFEDVPYDNSPIQYGVSGGHNIIVDGYNSGNTTRPPVPVNPQTAVPGVRANMTVTTDQAALSCGATFARDPNNPTNCTSFPNRCALPVGWQEVSTCTTTTPGTGGSCIQGQRVPNSGTIACSGQQRCMVYSYYSNSTTCATYQGQLEECGLVLGYCGYSQFSGSTYSDSTSYLQGQTQGFQDVVTYTPPVQQAQPIVEYQAPAPVQQTQMYQDNYGSFSSGGSYSNFDNNGVVQSFISNPGAGVTYY